LEFVWTFAANVSVRTATLAMPTNLIDDT